MDDLVFLDRFESSISLHVQSYLHAAVSDNTRRAYRSDLRHFLKWGGSIPASDTMVTGRVKLMTALETKLPRRYRTFHPDPGPRPYGQKLVSTFAEVPSSTIIGLSLRSDLGKVGWENRT